MPKVAAQVLMSVGLLVMSLWLGTWATDVIWESGWESPAELWMFLFDTGVTWFLTMLSMWLIWSRQLGLRHEHAQHQFLLIVACILILAVVAVLPQIGTDLDYWDIVNRGYDDVVPVGWFIGACWIASSHSSSAIMRRHAINSGRVRCSKCKYDMTDLNSTICPECGTKFVVGDIWKSGAIAGLHQAEWAEDSSVPFAAQKPKDG